MKRLVLTFSLLFSNFLVASEQKGVTVAFYAKKNNGKFVPTQEKTNIFFGSKKMCYDFCERMNKNEEKEKYKVNKRFYVTIKNNPKTPGANMACLASKTTDMGFSTYDDAKNFCDTHNQTEQAKIRHVVTVINGCAVESKKTATVPSDTKNIQYHTFNTGEEAALFMHKVNNKNENK